MPPYFLRNLFETAPDGPATRRLHYMASHLELKGTPIEGWKWRHLRHPRGQAAPLGLVGEALERAGPVQPSASEVAESASSTVGSPVVLKLLC